MLADHPDDWFIAEAITSTSSTNRPDVPRIYCFGHAGGNPRAFLRWQADLDAPAQLVPVVMPGRAHRFGQPMPGSIEEYADGAAWAISTADDRPFYLFGHSLGALVAFEVARRLGGSTDLRHLIASGSAAPSLLPSARAVRTAALEGRAFAEAVGFFGGLPPALIADEEVQRLLLHSVQADFRLVAGYTYTSAPSLRVPISLINGVDDSHVAPERLDPWAAETSLSVSRHWAPGGHFYFEDGLRPVLDLLRDVVTADALTDVSPDHSELVI
jgi:surfactin synthase thioesterase subunit